MAAEPNPLCPLPVPTNVVHPPHRLERSINLDELIGGSSVGIVFSLLFSHFCFPLMGREQVCYRFVFGNNGFLFGVFFEHALFCCTLRFVFGKNGFGQYRSNFVLYLILFLSTLFIYCLLFIVVYLSIKYCSDFVS